MKQNIYFDIIRKATWEPTDVNMAPQQYPSTLRNHHSSLCVQSQGLHQRRPSKSCRALDGFLYGIQICLHFIRRLHGGVLSVTAGRKEKEWKHFKRWTGSFKLWNVNELRINQCWNEMAVQNPSEVRKPCVKHIFRMHNATFHHEREKPQKKPTSNGNIWRPNDTCKTTQTTYDSLVYSLVYRLGEM